jgi:FixJ family two-component response regulator
MVLDIQLGGMSGMELRQHLVDVCDFTPVIFITGFDDPEMRAQALASGCAGFFHKTDLAREVLECIRRAVGLESESVAQGSDLINEKKVRTA